MFYFIKKQRLPKIYIKIKNKFIVIKLKYINKI